MKPTLVGGGYSVRTRCPGCGGAISTFEHQSGGNSFGSFVLTQAAHHFEGRQYSRIAFHLLRCAGCNRGALARIHDTGNTGGVGLEEFYPPAIERAVIPTGIVDGIVKEFREAELTASVGAWRAASALLRSTLEKTLRANGYTKGNLKERIDQAAADGVITAARRQKAHDDIRVLGNDVLHDEWRAVDPDEVDAAHHYVQRILEDFYDDRASVEAILKAKGRLPTP